MPTPNSQHYDVIIAGARCAGAATAMLLARQEARVLLDRSGMAQTPCRPTRSCAARCCSCTAGNCLTGNCLTGSFTCRIENVAFVYLCAVLYAANDGDRSSIHSDGSHQGRAPCRIFSTDATSAAA